MKPARLRPAATQDLLDGSAWYFDQGGPELAGRWFDAARQALIAVEREPGLGSMRLGRLAGFDRLRSWPVAGFPARWFYVEAVDHLDVLRLLGERQNVVRILGHENP